MRQIAFALAVILATPTFAQADMLIDDFTGTPQDRWRFFSDQVMGGVSTGQGALGADPAYIQLKGDVSTANNGGFIQLRRDLNGLPDDTNAITMRVRGDGQVYYIHLRTTRTRAPWAYYQAVFETTADWQEVTLPLSDFEGSRAGMAELNPQEVRSIGIVAFGRDHVADVSVERIMTRD